MKNKILLLDNSTSIRSPWKKLLNQYYQCVEAIGGFEALSKLRYNDFRLVIVNISIDSMNGVEAIGKIRNKYKLIPIIAIYNLRDTLSLKQAMNYGIQYAIKLPMDPRELIIAARKHVPINIKLIAKQTNKNKIIKQAKSYYVDVEVKFYEAMSAIASNELNQAIKIYNSLLSLTSIKKEGWRRYVEESLFHLGQCYTRLKNYPKANLYYKKFVTRVPHHSCVKESILYIGQNCQAMKDIPKATAYYKKVIKMRPFDSYSSQATKLLRKIKPT